MGESAPPLVHRRPVALGAMAIDFVRRAALLGGADVHLSGSDLGPLNLLAANARRVLTRAEIRISLWERDRVLAGHPVDRLVETESRGDCRLAARGARTTAGATGTPNATVDSATGWRSRGARGSKAVPLVRSILRERAPMIRSRDDRPTGPPTEGQSWNEVAREGDR